MNRKDRNKQKKKKERQERLRQEKHLRQSQPHARDEDDLEADSEDLPIAMANMPSAFRSEQHLRDLNRAIEERGIQSEEELQQFLQEVNRGSMTGGPSRLSGPVDPKSLAQDLAYQAMEHPDPDESLRLARQALQYDSECVDALTTIAGLTARSPKELIGLLEDAVAAGERALGNKFFTANRGRFWGIVETRPYMRTRAELAALLHETGDLAKAIGHYEALLDLNPNDNQGNRDPLLACYLEAANLDGAQRLLNQYAGGWFAVFAWGRVLERFLAGDSSGATAALQEARGKNRYVEAFLTGSRQIPRTKPDYYQPGHETEAIHAADCLRKAWSRHPDALAWLKTGSFSPGTTA